MFLLRPCSSLAGGFDGGVSVLMQDGDGEFDEGVVNPGDRSRLAYRDVTEGGRYRVG